MSNEKKAKTDSSIKESAIEQKDDHTNKENDSVETLKDGIEPLKKNASIRSVLYNLTIRQQHIINRLFPLESTPIHSSTKDSLDKQNSLKKIAALLNNNTFKSKWFRNFYEIIILLVLSLSVISFSWFYNHGDNKNIGIFVCNYITKGIKFKKMYNNPLGKTELEIIFKKKLNSVTHKKLVKILQA